MQNLTDLVVAYLMTLFQLQRSESVECGGELIMNAYRYTAVLSARAVAYRGGVWGVQTPPPRNSEDIGGVFDRMSKKNRRLDFLL